MAARNYGQYCGVVSALELVGERWALLIVRDLLVGPRRYSDLKQGLPRIPTNILSTRLKELQQGGVVRRVPLAHGLVYDLTEYGRGLEDVILALGRWGFQRMGEPGENDVVTADSLTMTFRTAFAPDAAGGQPATVYEVHVGDVVLTLRVHETDLTVTRGAVTPGTVTPGAVTSGAVTRGAVTPGIVAGGADLAFAANLRIRKVISGELSPESAIADGTVRILDGDAALLERFALTFHLESAHPESAQTESAPSGITAIAG
jgi:DNA-binding HxlR family transcriptional regulator